MASISGQENREIEAIAHAAYGRQRRNPGVTEIVEMPGRGRWRTIDHGWREVARAALGFVERCVG